MLFYSVLLLGSVIFLDACLSGDNVVVIAMAANGLDKSLRNTAIYAGMALAAILRVLLAFVATQLLQYRWVGLVGGVLLLWVAYKLFKDLIAKDDVTQHRPSKVASMGVALLMIVAADLSMSLDNVLAVAALARDHTWIMVIGILVSIYMLTLAAKRVADLMQRWPWLNWVGLVLIIYVAIDLIAATYDIHLALMRLA